MARVLTLAEKPDESLLTLEFAVQECYAGEDHERRPNETLSAPAYERGEMEAEITLKGRSQSFLFLPPNLLGTNFCGAVRQLSSRRNQI